MKADALLDHASSIQLTYSEAIVDHKLSKLRNNMKTTDHAICVTDYHDRLQVFLDSPLFQCLKLLPKPAVHLAHLVASAPSAFLLDLTYKSCVYFSKRENKFLVSHSGTVKDGYVKVNDLRQYWKNSEQFDAWLKQKMELRPPVEARTDHAIWSSFQPMIDLCYDLYHFKPFFEKIVNKVCRAFIAEMVTVVEFRHVLGHVFDESGATLSIE